MRSEMGFSPPGNSDVGVEVGASPGRFEVQLGVVNGTRGSILDGETQNGADHTAKTDGGDGVGQATKRAGRALVVLRQGPHAPRTSCH